LLDPEASQGTIPPPDPSGVPGEIEKVYAGPLSVVIASERYSLASRVARSPVRILSPPRASMDQILSAITALAREFGAKRAVAIAALDSILSVFVGGLAYRLLSLVL